MLANADRDGAFIWGGVDVVSAEIVEIVQITPNQADARLGSRLD